MKTEQIKQLKKAVKYFKDAYISLYNENTKDEFSIEFLNLKWYYSDAFDFENNKYSTFRKKLTYKIENKNNKDYNEKMLDAKTEYKFIEKYKINAGEFDSLTNKKYFEWIVKENYKGCVEKIDKILIRYFESIKNDCYEKLEKNLIEKQTNRKTIKI